MADLSRRQLCLREADSQRSVLQLLAAGGRPVLRLMIGSICLRHQPRSAWCALSCRRQHATASRNPAAWLARPGHTAPGPVAEPGYCSTQSRTPGNHGWLESAWGRWRAMPHRGFKSPPVRVSSSYAAIWTSADLVPITESRRRHGSVVGRVAGGTRFLGQGSMHVSVYSTRQWTRGSGDISARPVGSQEIRDNQSRDACDTSG